MRDSVISMLGSDRAKRVANAVEEVASYASTAPQQASWVRHIPIQLSARDSASAEDELAKHLEQHGSNWFAVTAVARDGRRMGLASDVFTPLPTESAVAQFFFLDIHSCLGGWWLSHLWRAADLADCAAYALNKWQLAPAAASTRALLEGVAAFVVEGEEMLADWSEFKARGTPTLQDVSAYRDRAVARLAQAQLGSRIGERSGAPITRIKRTNIMTLLAKYQKRSGSSIESDYEWLCDAVHPSFGFGTAYVATQGVHRAGCTFAADLAWRTDNTIIEQARITPDLANACADTLCTATTSLLRSARRLRWFIDDIGLTTNVAYALPQRFLGSLRPEAAEGLCPCGSPVGLRDCNHAWGLRSEPPQDAFGVDRGNPR